jgi:hypothetical protein
MRAITHLGGEHRHGGHSRFSAPERPPHHDQRRRPGRLALVVSHLLVQALKRTVARPRPHLGVGLDSLVAAPDRFSFPSGHAAASLSMALAGIALLPPPSPAPCWPSLSWSEPAAAIWAVVLTHSLWRRLGADPDIIGTDVLLNGNPWTVIGVMGPDFRFVVNASMTRPLPADAFAPLLTRPAEGTPISGTPRGSSGAAWHAARRR